jgi:hypothetical protein
MRLYHELSDWYPLLTTLADYLEEAAQYREVLLEALGPGRHTLLELGAGAGANAHYLRDRFELTLTDLSPRMLELAARHCPGARTVAGDMRTLRLGETFDAVFMHDAIVYLRSEAELAGAFATAHLHLRPGGVVLVAPDYVTETFAPGLDCGGSDGEGRSLRYLEWTWQEPGVTGEYVTDFTLVMREGTGEPRVVNDRHREGLFPRATWLGLLEQAGFEVQRLERPNPDGERELDLFLGRRRTG